MGTFPAYQKVKRTPPYQAWRVAGSVGEEV